MSDGRTIWWSKDARWWAREAIVELGEEFGAAGPAVIDYLSGEAKLQNDGGRVKAGVRSVARGCFVEVNVVREVLSRSVTLSLLDEFEQTGGRFTCRISGWQKDQGRGQAAFRKQQQRARESVESPAPEPNDDPGHDVTSHAPSRPVTQGHAESHTGENRTEEENPPSPPLRGGSSRPGRRRDRERLEAEMRAWAVGLVQRHGVKPTRQRIGEAITAVSMVNAARGEVTDELVLERLRSRQPNWPHAESGAAT